MLAIGALIIFIENTKGIFKKDALSTGLIIYLLWWLWVITIILFGFAMFALTFESYYSLFN